MRQIQVTELKQKFDNDGSTLQLIDVREPWEFQICHIDGSVLIPMRDIPNSVAELNQDLETIVVCHTGVRSNRVCMYLEQAGFTNVANLVGGVHAWANEIDSTMPTY